MLDLPQRFAADTAGGGVIQDSASSAALCALLAARERATDGASNRTGVSDRLVAYCSTQSHSSIAKAVRIAGLGGERLRAIDVDASYAMCPEQLALQMEADRQAGLVPFFVVATVGSTSSCALDPVRAIGEVCAAHGAWLHVDAAMAGTAAVCPEFRDMHDGVELADSYCFNPHKWMFVNFDCNAFYVADRTALIRALGILPEYLKNAATASGQVIDYRDWQVPLGRRFRSLKLWFVIRHYGVEGIRHHVREHVRMAQDLSQWIDAHPDFERTAPVPLNLVCFRHLGGEAVNVGIMDRLNASGALYLTHTRLGGEFTLRMAIGATQTRSRHVKDAWERIVATAVEVVTDLDVASHSL